MSQAVSRASRQADRPAETHSLASFQLRTTIKTLGNPDVQEQSVVEWLNTRRVIRLAPVGIPAGGSAIAGSADQLLSALLYSTLVQTLLTTNF